jgi:peptidoglycan hydrolase-like protein with peptidoglycan-binding domain
MSMALNSQLFRGDARLEAAAVSNPAHIAPGARGEHVRKIQRALNLLENAGLEPDGTYGQATADAVLAYKEERGIINQSYETQADNIVGIMTMTALDADMAANEGSANGVPLVSRSPIGACDEQAPAEAKAGSGASDLQPADPVTVAAIAKLVVKVRLVITAARFQLTVAGPFVRANEKLTVPRDPFQAPARQALNLLINVFSMDKHKNPRPGFDNIRRVFGNMDVALNRSFETAPLIAPVLFVPNTHKSMEKDLAYTTAGGAFKSSKIKIKGLGVPADRIYVCDSITKETDLANISTLVHELAHFVSGQPLKISHENGVPRQGLMLRDRTAFDKITPEAKLRSAEHYAFFAMAAGFRRVSTD